MSRAPPRTEKAIQLASRTTAMALSAGWGGCGALDGDGDEGAAMAQTTGTNIFMCVVRCRRRCQRQRAMRCASRLAVAL